MTRNTSESQRCDLFVTAITPTLTSSPQPLSSPVEVNAVNVQHIRRGGIFPFIVRWNSLMDDKIAGCAVATANNATTQQHNRILANTHKLLLARIFVDRHQQPELSVRTGQVWVFVASDHFVELNMVLAVVSGQSEYLRYCGFVALHFSQASFVVYGRWWHQWHRLGNDDSIKATIRI